MNSNLIGNDQSQTLVERQNDEPDAAELINRISDEDWEKLCQAFEKHRDAKNPVALVHKEMDGKMTLSEVARCKLYYYNFKRKKQREINK